MIAPSLGMPGSFGMLARGPGGIATGFVLARVHAGEVEIMTLCVAPSFRAAGQGKLLLTAALAEAAARQAGEVFLEVAADNAAALALYGRAGFAEVGRRSGYYARGSGRVDALMMKKVLKPA
jgi:ribosomal-protein-alanine N-acetyltransferase